MKLLYVIGVCLASTGCVSTADQRANIEATDYARCEGYGFKIGTNEFAQCRMEQERRRDAAMQQVLAGIYSRRTPIAPTYQMQVPRSVTCNSTPMGNTVMTNCN